MRALPSIAPEGRGVPAGAGLSLRLGIAGGIAGMLGGLVEFVLHVARARAFLPTGILRLCGFLVGAYGLAGLLAGVLLGGLGALLLRGDVGRAVRGDGSPGSRVAAYALLSLAALVGVGVAARYIVEGALLRFHHRQLIGVLSGAAICGVALAGALLVLVLAPAVSRLVRLGPRVQPVLRGAPVALLPAIALGAYLAIAAIAAQVVYLIPRPRMTHAVRGLNAALAAPFLALTALALAWAAYRALARTRLGAARPSGSVVLASTVAALVLPAGAAAALTWSTTRQLDLRPFAAGALIVVGTLALGRRLAPRPLALVGLALLQALLVFSLGRIDRVRKATTLVGLAPHLVRGIQLATDLDRDGFSSVLGGGDCDDLDRRVHPGAFDWPDDGIDQDCNGHQATLAAPRRRGAVAVPPAVPDKPNVLLITIDALRADHVTSYQYERRTTPRLDDLAKEGIRFENAWAHAPSTRYSVPAILIGRYPSTIPVNNDPRVHWPPQVLPENRTLAEIMRDLGYRTGAALSYHYFERGWGLDQGFDDYDYHLYTLHSVGGDPSATTGSSARELADLDIGWLRAHAAQPFFLWTHFYDTHFRFQAHPDLPESNFGSDEIAQYDGEIRYTDHHVGRVLDTLRELGLWDRTIIIVTADHGDGFGEHGIPVSRRHGYHLYRTETKVPVIVRVPGLPPRIVDTPIGHVDLIPTLLDLLRRPAGEEPQLLGESLVPAMLGDESRKDERAIYQEVWYEGPTSKKGLATRGWHLVRNLVPEDTSELYDLSRDPGEEHDLSGNGEAIEAQLRARLGEITDALAIPPRFATRLKDAISRSARPTQRPLGDELGELVRVVGADVDRARARAGETVEVTVELEVRRPIPDGWILFTHATARGGRSMNLDHVPLEGLLPLATIAPGTFVRDPIRVALPPGWPPGPTRVELGLYRRGQRARATGAHSAADAVTVATIDVTP